MINSVQKPNKTFEKKWKEYIWGVYHGNLSCKTICVVYFYFLRPMAYGPLSQYTSITSNLSKYNYSQQLLLWEVISQWEAF